MAEKLTVHANCAPHIRRRKNQLQKRVDQENRLRTETTDGLEQNSKFNSSDGVL